MAASNDFCVSGLFFLRVAMSHAQTGQQPAAESLLSDGWMMAWLHTANAATGSQPEAANLSAWPIEKAARRQQAQRTVIRVYQYSGCKVMGNGKTVENSGKMTVIKSLNNNMVFVRDSDGIKRICQGKGIGFQKKSGDKIDWSQVERSYIPENEQDQRHFQQLFSEIPDEYWEIAEKVVEYGRDYYKIKVSDRVILPLCDHMAGSVERYKKGTVLSNPMLWDIKRVYSDEFQIGKYAIKILNERFGVEMQEDEAAFLAYHFVNAELGSLPNVSPDSMAKLIASVLDIVQESFQVKLNDEDWNYQRFVTHLKFFASRIVQRSGYQDEADDELFEELSERYKPVRKCVDRIADYILIEYHYDLSIDERLYLLIHIQRVTKRYMKKKRSAVRTEDDE